MPIKGLTYEDEESGGGGFGSAEGLPRIFTLRKGGERPASGKAPGKDLKHFRADFAPEYAHLLPAFEHLYGKAPRQIDGLFLVGQNVSQVFPHWMEDWNASTLLHRCDKETQVRHWNADAMAYSDAPAPCVSETAGCNCKQTGRLLFVLPALIQETGILGTGLLTTTSVYDIIALNGYLESIYQMHGKLQGIPFTLFRAERDVAVNMNGKRGRQTKSLVGIHAAPEYVVNKILPALAAPVAENAGSLPPADELPDLAALPSGDDLPADPAEFYEHGLVIAAELFGMVIKSDKDGRRYMVFDTSEGTATSWTRRPFIERGWIAENDWVTEGYSIEFEAAPAVQLKVNVRDDGQQFMELVDIEAFNPDWDDVNTSPF